jgi:hypothetical protein
MSIMSMGQSLSIEGLCIIERKGGRTSRMKIQTQLCPNGNGESDGISVQFKEGPF